MSQVQSPVEAIAKNIVDLVSSSDEEVTVKFEITRRSPRRIMERHNNDASSVDLKWRSNEYDVRVNLDEDHLDSHLAKLEHQMYSEYQMGTLAYGHISGVEIGENKKYGSYKKKHVHMALVYKHRSTLGAVIKKYCKHANTNYYAVPRDKTLPYDGWVNYHGKAHTKMEGEPEFRYMVGELSKLETEKKKRKAKEAIENLDIEVPASVPKDKVKQYVNWEKRKRLVKAQDWDTLEELFPGTINNALVDQLNKDMKEVYRGGSCICPRDEICICSDSSIDSP